LERLGYRTYISLCRPIVSGNTPGVSTRNRLLWRAIGSIFAPDDAHPRESLMSHLTRVRNRCAPGFGPLDADHIPRIQQHFLALGTATQTLSVAILGTWLSRDRGLSFQ
jgi:hypothetical protein